MKTPGTKSCINEENQTLMEVLGANEEGSAFYNIVFILLLLHLLLVPTLFFAFVRVVNALGKRSSAISHRRKASLLAITAQSHSSAI